MTATRRDDLKVRGVVVLLVVVVIGLALLARSGDSGNSEASTTEPGASSSSTTVPAVTRSTLAPINKGTSKPTDDTAPTTKPAGEVTVIVLNGTRKAGIAAVNEAKVDGAGYQTISATNSDTPADTTKIFYADGYQPEAEAMKLILGLGEAPVEAAPAEPLAPTAGDANVVVLLGEDFGA